MDQVGDYRSGKSTVFWPPAEAALGNLAALVFFRSPRPQLSWLTAGGAVLDTASLVLAAVEVPYEVSAALCIRAGFLALRRIATFLGVENPADPHFPQDPISISRIEFDETLEKLASAGLPLKPDREQAWMDFAGWRVNYDRSLTGLCDLVMAPYAPWSSDRFALRRQDIESSAAGEIRRKDLART